MSCDEFADVLADFLERDVAEPVRAAVETHARECADCGPLLADLRRLRADAARLPELAPSRDLWAGIAQRIETPVVEIGHKVDAPAVRRANRSRAWTMLAAAALVGVTATTTYVLTRQSFGGKPGAPAATVAVNATPVATLGSPAPDSAKVNATPANAATTTNAVSPKSESNIRPRTAGGAQLALASNKLSPEATFDSEISRLRRIVDGRRGNLDSSTVAVLEKNLKIIDDAISQCRVALKKDPHSDYLNESLNQALDNKVQLLRTAAGLPVKM